ncbi:MAG: electron transport complex protein RnfC, partial [Flavobacterium sp.]|nr:electron transport complex protein RnfC [Flavobacterium sp.]
MNIVELVKNAGVVGAGGAGFPTHVKLQSKVDTVIANGAECEPLLRIDQQMMDINAAKVVRGVELAMQSTGAKRGIVAVKKKYHNAIESLNQQINKLTNQQISLFLLDNFYPTGDEFVTVYEVTKRIIPEGGLPLQVSCVVDNVVTLMNIANAIDEGKPVTDRPLTICGAVKNPISLVLPVGTSVKRAIEIAGGISTDGQYTIFDGGPMMGSIIDDDAVVTKKTSGIMVLPSDHEVVYQKTNRHAIKQVKSACEQCQDCTEICPRYLLGHNFECHKIQRGIQAGLSDNLTQAFMCCECGLCDWVCPVKLTPRRTNQMVKKELMKNGVKNPHNKKPDIVREMRQYRKVALPRVLGRNDLIKYDVSAPFNGGEFKVDEVKIP